MTPSSPHAGPGPTPSGQGPLLEVNGLSSGYGDMIVLRDVSVRLQRGDTYVLLGRNGAGKSSLIMTLIGLLPARSGSIRFAGAEVAALPTEKRVRLGFGWVPQGRRIFPHLSVEETLLMAARPGPWTIEAVYDLFPRLGERRQQRSGLMSGGEQQMLAIGRALVLNPQLLLLDEPTEGLAPRIAASLQDALQRVAADGMTMLLVEQRPDWALAHYERCGIMERGSIVHEGASQDVRVDHELLSMRLGISAVTT